MWRAVACAQQVHDGEPVVVKVGYGAAVQYETLDLGLDYRLSFPSCRAETNGTMLSKNSRTVSGAECCIFHGLCRVIMPSHTATTS